MANIGLYEAKTHFSEYSERAAHGETIVVTRHGTPYCRIVPLESRKPQASADAAYERLKAGARVKLAPGTIKKWREEGHR